MCLYSGPNIGSCSPDITIFGLDADLYYTFEIVNGRGQHIRVDAQADCIGSAFVDLTAILPTVGDTLTLYLVDPATGAIVPLYFEDCGVCGAYLGVIMPVISMFGAYEVNLILCEPNG